QPLRLGRVEPPPVPDDVAGASPDPGELRFGAERDDDPAVEHGLIARAELPLAVEVLPLGPAEGRPGVLGSGSHGPAATPSSREANVRFPAHNTRSVTVGRASRHVSVKDVAARSGVSFQTTSKVLNGGGSVAEATRARILQAASDLGYVPNLQARSLVMQRTRTTGLITGDFSDPGLSRCLAGAEQEARRQGYGLMLTSMEPEGSGTEYALPAMMERRVDGILLAAPQMEDDRALGHVLDRTLPVVSTTHIAGGGVTTVSADDEEAGQVATRHLLEPAAYDRARAVLRHRRRGDALAAEDGGGRTHRRRQGRGPARAPHRPVVDRAPERKRRVSTRPRSSSSLSNREARLRCT